MKFQFPIAMLLGYILDLIFGDPLWLPHPVQLMGKLITALEKLFRKILPKTQKGEMTGGFFVVLIVSLTALFVSWGILYLAEKIGFALYFVIEVIMIYQTLSTKSLKKESMKVYWQLAGNNIEKARKALSMIVGRDTAELGESEIVCAAVETVAENTTDGIIAPLIFLSVGGAPLGMLYKAINTMDSMLGYRNEKYIDFGFFAAKFDDAANFIPARAAGLLMCVSAFFAGFDMKNSFRIFRRDRLNHLSPNSAHTEAACAGALGIMLGGTHKYFGETVEKPTIGDSLRPAEAEDIRRADRLMYATSIFGFLICLLIGFLVRFFIA